MQEFNFNAVPPERAAEMPEQALSSFVPTTAITHNLRRRRTEPLRVQALRCLFVVGVAATVGIGVWLLADRLGRDGLDVPEAVLVLVYGILLLWLAGNFWLCVAGAFASGHRRSGENTLTDYVEPSPSARTAILMPLHNENPRDAFARLSAMIGSVQGTDAADNFDFFVLSDSTEPRRYLEEEWLWLYTRKQLGVADRLFYRRRDNNTGRKAGNIAEFCRRWGSAYDYIVVLDADSLMSGDALVECVRRMNANPALGLLQTWPRPIGGTTVFARAQQFAAVVAGPLMVRGMSVLGGSVGNYWGHNAIIRTRAFVESCGLPRLPGRPPLGGDILSHDFVEAALLVRNGWEVRLAPDIAGSYEQAPPNLLESLRRDRRWCQGNLQHLRVILARGLHPISRVNLFIGILSFVVAPVWLVFIALGIIVAWRSGLSEGSAEVSAQTFRGLEAAETAQVTALLSEAETMTLLGLTVLLLLGPKLLGLLAALLTNAMRTAHGGPLRLSLGSVLETALFALIAPGVMLAHSRFVADVLLGRSVGWTAPQRDAARVTWAEAAPPLLWILLAAVVMATLAASLAPQTVWWLIPILLSAGLAIPLAVLTGRRDIDAALRRHGLLGIPEENNPAQVQRDCAAWLSRLETQSRHSRDPISVLRSLVWLQLHSGMTPISPISADPERLEETRRLAIDRGLEDLTPDDCRVLLGWPEALVQPPQKTEA